MSPGGRVSASSRDGESNHYLRFSVNDPAAIGPITTVLERNRVGVARAAAVWARNASAKHQVRVLTHSVSRKTLDTALLDIAGSGIETGKRMILRVAG